MSVLSRIGTFLGDIGRASAAVRTFERLEAMSDARLAARGLRRSDIAAAALKTAFGRSLDR